MLIPEAVLRGVADGRVTLAFRRWRRPTVRDGGTLLTSAGQLQIRSVAIVGEEEISEADARHAGFESLEALRRELGRRTAGDVYRIEFGDLLPDPRLRLREAVPDAGEVEGIVARLDRLDRASRGGPWTRVVLGAVAENPGMRAEDLARRIGVEREVLKRNVRKLKNLGLTISLGTGYRLSARGEAVLERLPR